MRGSGATSSWASATCTTLRVDGASPKTWSSRTTALQDDELVSLYDFNPVAQTIVNAIVVDGLRQGFETPGESDEELQKAAREKKTLQMVGRTAKWGRAVGGAVIIADTGDDLAPRLDETKPTARGSLRRFIVRSRMENSPVYSYDVEDGAEFFDLAPIQDGATVRIHRSRMRIFGGRRI
ncbi:MAG: DUF1073 domain-containing protein [Sandaracinaceae bacterium]|nr:DUF1073 domain-containing protein [Sandaracinaceae bacterium]